MKLQTSMKLKIVYYFQERKTNENKSLQKCNKHKAEKNQKNGSRNLITEGLSVDSATTIR